MTLDRLFNIASLIVGVALVSVIFTSPNTAAVIRATGSAFSGSIRAAKGS